MTNNLEDIAAYDTKYKNASEIKVDALPININDDNLSKMVDAFNIAEDDIIIVEIIKPTNQWCFVPISNNNQEENKMFEPILI